MDQKLPRYEPSLEAILKHIDVLAPCQVPLHQALGRVLRSKVTADRDQPPFDRAAMDGFAVRSWQVRPGQSFVVTGTIAAGAPLVAYPDDPGQVMRIATGSPVPAGADAVVPNELAKVRTDSAEQVQFTVDSVQNGDNVHRRGSDATAGQSVVDYGTQLGPHHIGIAASVGATQLEVAEVPKVTLLTSGDEVRPADTSSQCLAPQQIRNSNGPMLRAFFAALGVPNPHYEHLPDEPEPTLDRARAAALRSQLVVTVGGVSAGHRDLLPWAWQQLGLETVLHGVAIQPGKPLFVAIGDGVMVVGLPGNPVSVLATAHLFVWPALRKMLGLASDLPWRQLALAGSVKATARRQLFRAAQSLTDGTAAVIDWHGSGDLIHTAEADGFVRLPLFDGLVNRSTQVPFLPLVR